MALWGKTDALGSVPKYIARTATVASTKINATDNTIDISGANTGFNTGDQVAYTGDAATEGNYFVRVVSAGVISLYGTATQASAGGATGKADLSAGSGNHSLQATGVQGSITLGGQQIIFVDAQEAQVSDNKAKGITGAGWWAFRTYTDSDSVTRTKAECLIAMSAASGDSGDAEDTIAVDLAITIATQPADTTVDLSDSTTDTATFTVEASVNSALPLRYQWQKQEGGTGAWAAITGASAAEYTTGVLTVLADNGDKYRVVVTADDATSVTSDAATLTVQA